MKLYELFLEKLAEDWMPDEVYTAARASDKARRASHLANRTPFIKPPVQKHDFEQRMVAGNTIKVKKPRLRKHASAAWTRKEGKDPEGGLNAKGVASYRKANPGSKLQTAVTTEPSKLDPDSKDAKRRKSFCARMGGMPGAMKDAKGRPTRKALSLRKWNC